MTYAELQAWAKRNGMYVFSDKGGYGEPPSCPSAGIRYSGRGYLRTGPYHATLGAAKRTLCCAVEKIRKAK